MRNKEECLCGHYIDSIVDISQKDCQPKIFSRSIFMIDILKTYKNKSSAHKRRNENSTVAAVFHCDKKGGGVVMFFC